MYFKDVKGIDIEDFLKTKTAPSLKHQPALNKRIGHRKYASISLALKKFLSTSKLSQVSIGTEHVGLVEATDRILANRILCPLDIPPFQRSTVDGFAILSSDTRNAKKDHHAELDVVGKISAGKNFRVGISPAKAVAIATGAKIPKGADSVIMIEDVIIEDKGKRIFIPYRTKKGSNISARGSDLKKGQILLRQRTWLNAGDIGLIASVGISKINVYKKIKVAVLSTGSELAEPGSDLANASIFDSNRFMLFSMARKHGGEPIDLGICRDERSLIHAKIVHEENLR